MNNNLFAVTNIVASFSEKVVIKLKANVITNVINWLHKALIFTTLIWYLAD